MFDRKFVFAVFLVVFATLALETRHTVEARYLPTRSNGDRVDKLRELLKDLLQSEIEKEEYQADAPQRWHPENKLFYKREAPAH
ncbi:hypothetical protein MTP99_005619 [Tenebrio molitor]|uniref:Proctolin 1 n=1 Tax=Tenebrio molitor TaxID=7067 RepID=A0A8J6HNJ1_TENMO|nr:hypothetical protein GEV33_004879 [Tenebrio molitor]KAJ3618809.1 hypothetical protein MTP99_005619 [Tenebrio molitor]UXO98102.1 proctolin 1 [Tenebrio molitor]CAH1381675.1 unnamed protein product [Tenebrio molitor]